MVREPSGAVPDPEPGPIPGDSVPGVDVEKLGRQRPAVFKTIWAELGFVTALLGSMLMAVGTPSARCVSTR